MTRIAVDEHGEGQRPQNSTSYDPIAIVGMAMRLPGGVHSGEDLWSMLTDKRSGLCDVPKSRYNIDAFHDSDGKAGTVRMKQAYFLEDVELLQFDNSVFSTSKMELERLDPQQRQFLEVTYECLENAGSTSWHASNIGCYVGMFGEDWLDLNAKEPQHRGGYRVTGYGDFVLGNRVSYEFDLHGPSMTVKTGCSSSLVCLDLACKAIRDGDCDGAVVGGTSLILSPTMTLALSDQGVLSPTGTCQTFDAAADGYARGEAITAIYIKRLSHAMRDDDPIRAIIRGTSVNCDGRTHGMITPSSDSQAAVIRRAYEVTGINDLSQTAVVECHGTGTAVGDPLEAAAVAECFCQKGVVITSVKPNVGHSEGAAGVTSLIKAVLALEHRQVPPNINFTTPNPNIPFAECNLRVPVDVEAWPAGRAERVSVNSFGIGGVNAHVVLESARQFGVQQGSATVPDEGPHLLLFSAHSAASLEGSIESYVEYPQQGKASLRDVAYTLSSRRTHLSHRAYAVTDRVGSLPSFTGSVVKTTPKIAWMGAQLIDADRIFRNSIHALDQFLQSLPSPPPWTIEAELRKGPESSRVHRAEMGHPLTIAVQIGLINVLRSWGVTPSLVVGHSAGELAAAFASGAISAEAAIAAATFRGTGNATSSRPGYMAAIGLGREDVVPYLESGVVIACEDSQLSVTLSGDTPQLEAAVHRMQTRRPDVLARFLRVEKAFHSHHMWEYGPEYEDHIQPFVQSISPTIPFYSAVTGDRLAGEGSLGPGYWRRNIESPVLFNTALRSVLRDHLGDLVLILRDVGRPEAVHVGTLQRGQICRESLLHLAGHLFQQHVPLDFPAICPPGELVKDLPRYSWKRDISHWAEPRVAKEWRFREHPPHELLGSRVVELGSEPCWRNVLAMDSVPWLAAHEMDGQTPFPAAGYIAMVGEALRQLEGKTAYSLRQATIASAVVLEADRATELVTSLRPIALDASEKSPWYSFTISCFDGPKWTRNCYGEARAAFDSSVSLAASEPGLALPRKMDETSWYNVLNRVGFNSTGLFRGLQRISAATVGRQASAVVPETTLHTQGQYALHPGVIDQCFQLFTVSAYRGLARDCLQLAVPTFIEEIVISPNNGDLQVTADIDRVERGSFVGDLVAQASGRKMLSLTGFKTSALNANSEPEELPLITQFEWKPHADFATMSQLIHPRTDCPPEWSFFEELTILCMLDNREQIQPEEKTPEHLHTLFAWMATELERYQSGSNIFVPSSRRLEDHPREARLVRIEELAVQVATSLYAVLAMAVHRLFAAAPAIFAGEAHPLHVLLEGNLLSDWYVVGDTLEYADALQVLGHTNPRMRVLEIGAGTGGTTRKILQALTPEHGGRLYGSYTYTDISGGFMPAAKERFAKYEGIEYACFELGHYDLIIGTNVVDATPCLQTTLRNLRGLLRAGGRLFLQELCPAGSGRSQSVEIKFVSYAMGFLSGWWLGLSDNRADQPFVSPSRWLAELVAAGFEEPEAMVLDGIPRYHLSAGIVASVASQKEHPSRVTVLSYRPDGPYVHETMRCLEARGVSVDLCSLGDHLPQAQNVISLLDQEHPALHDMSETTFHSIVGHLKALEGKMISVTQPSQGNCENPRAAMVLGPDGMDPEWEFAIVNGKVVVPRLQWQTVSDAFAQSCSSPSPAKHLTLQTPGLLHTLEWADKRSGILNEGEVWVQTRAVGLNFRDVLIALGVIDNSSKELGLEGSGIVEAVGPNVHTVSVGDWVMYMASGCFTTSLTLHETACVKMDASMTFEQAAALPCVYATAAMALIDKVQSVLIHSACGGVGLAAIQIAQMVGAEIYCTVGNETKTQYLTENYHIPRSHILYSRDSSFLRDIMRATDSRGVDVVLNSLSGDLLHASWKCVAELGVMVETGKRDFRRRAKLAMETFEANRTFVGLDLWHISQNRPMKAADNSFPASQIQEAFRFMQAGRHIGKIVINVPEATLDLCSARVRPLPTLRSDRSYLLVGGLGGLGRAVATWMVEHGARSLVFLSRSAGRKPSTHAFVEELSSQGCQVQLVAGSVRIMADVEMAVKHATLPIAGVINMTMVLKDVSLSQMNFADWKTAVEPKVQGTWNLHNALPSVLDFFILCSSYSGIAGHSGQANYAAPNSFLDAFVQYRHHEGRPASVIDIGVVGEVGYVSQNSTVLNHFRKSGLHILKEQDLLDAMNLAMERSHPLPVLSESQLRTYRTPSQILLGLNTTAPMSAPANLVSWKHDMRLIRYWNVHGGTEASSVGSSDTGSLKEFVAAATARPGMLAEEATTTIIATAVAVALSNFLIRDQESIALSDSLQSLGVDSLVAVETSVFTLLQTPSVLHLGDHLRQALVSRLGS
ncbi:putative polyketide synthase [Aspergillus ellipticus CBS 707.79]|uniref:Putative polyketide synthase n=1 Tax=Aspergillus ellipticus CBS 707.79 TaxID=1448320 RepID=A0A319DNQ3_9EURO|nr:putative polyketide synthase [Aspergillus ellipticus CBS 707.79]